MANEYKDYYKILGIEKSADDKAIKKAYRKLARQHHPDVNPNSTDSLDKFREVSEAYEVLGDPEKRTLYDKYGEHYSDYESWKKAGGEATGVPFDVYMSGGVRAGAGARAGGGGGGGSSQYRTVNPEDLQDLFGDDSPYSDFFYSIFGGQQAGAGPRPSGPIKGRNQEYLVQVSLEEAFSGAKRTLELSGGPGQPRRRVEASIPAGIDDGGRVRLSGLGEPGRNGGPAGDLFLVIEILPHVFFERKGADLYAKVSVPLTTAILGGEVPVPTIKGGRLAMKVPAGSQNGSQIRLRGQGMVRRVGAEERGDLYVQLQVTLPTDLSAEERTAFEKFARLLEERQQGSSKGGVA